MGKRALGRTSLRNGKDKDGQLQKEPQSTKSNLLAPQSPLPVPIPGKSRSSPPLAGCSPPFWAAQKDLGGSPHSTHAASPLAAEPARAGAGTLGPWSWDEGYRHSYDGSFTAKATRQCQARGGE